MTDTYSQRTLSEILRIVFSRLGTIVFITLLAGGLTYFICLISPKWYRSEVDFYYRQVKNPNPFADPVFKDRQLEVSLKLQREIVKSDYVLSRALALLENRDLRERFMTPEELNNGEEFTREQLDPTTPLGGELQKAAADILANRQPDLARFARHITIQTPGGEDIAQSENFTIAVEQPEGNGGMGRRAQTAANLVAKLYMARLRELNFGLERRNVQFADDQVKAASARVQEASNKLNAFIAQPEVGRRVATLEALRSGIVDAGDARVRTEAALDLARLEAKAQNLTRLKSQIDTYLQQLRPFVEQNRLDEVALVVPSSLINDNPIIKAKLEQLAKLEAQRASQESVFTSEYVALRYTLKEIRASKREVIDELVRQSGGIGTELNSLQAQIESLAQVIRDNDRTVGDISQQYVAYNLLSTELTAAREAHETAVQEQLRITQALRLADTGNSPVMLDSGASFADDPVRPLTIPYTAIALAAGLLLGLTYAFVADYYDHSLKSVDEAERYVGVPVLGSVGDLGRRRVFQ